MSDVEGALTLNLTPVSGAIGGLRVASTRRVDACRVFEGRAFPDALRLIPSLFSICGTAQAHAALLAGEAALGIEPAPPQRAARRLLLAAETAGEHAWRALLDWPGLIGEPGAVEALAGLRKTLAAIPENLYPDGDWNRLGGGRLQPNLTALRQAAKAFRDGIADTVLGPPWDKPRNADALIDWARTDKTPAARLVRHLLDEDLAGAGATDIAPLPDLDRTELEGRLAADWDRAFVARPDWGGDLYHTGPLARRWDRPLVRSLRERFGNGLLAWFVARIDELANLDKAMGALIPGLGPDGGGGEAEANGSGIGTGVVEAARGRLVHRVELEGGVVGRYQILAPTEWNFHPDGVLAKGLDGVPVDRAERVAELLSAAVDPCVACRIEVG